MVTSTINTIPVAGASFLAVLQNFLREEDADRFDLILNPFVVQNGLHGTGGSLTGDPGDTIAFPQGFFVNETGTIVYNDNTAHHWVIIFKDTTTVVGGDWVRVSGTHYLFDPVAAVQPSVPAGGLILMDVVTSGGSITTVTDLRNLSAFAVQEDVFKVKVSSDDTTANTLLAKLTAGGGITLTETNPGANEEITIDADALSVVSTNDTTPGFIEDKITAGAGLKETVQNAFGDEDLLLDIDLATTSGMEFTGGKLRVNTVANGVVAIDSNGTVLDINGTATITGVGDETADTVIVHDDSATGVKTRKVITQDLIPIASQSEAETGTNNTKRMTPLRTTQAIGGRTEVFTASGTYTVPDRIASVFVIAVAAGGQGGGGTSGANTGGGGGGAQIIKAVVTVTPGGSETVTIGAGGTSGGGTGSPGNAGGDTTFGSLVTAKGGSGGATANPAGAGGAAGTGSSTTGTDITIPVAHAGTAGGSGTGGNGGSAPEEWVEFNGGLGAASGNGNDATLLGSGGGGGSSSAPTVGGDGADGYMIITPIE